MMSGAASQIVRRGEVSKEAEAQARQQQLMMKAYLELLGQRGRPQLPGQGQGEPRAWNDEGGVDSTWNAGRPGTRLAGKDFYNLGM